MTNLDNDIRKLDKIGTENLENLKIGDKVTITYDASQVGVVEGTMVIRNQLHVLVRDSHSRAAWHVVTTVKKV